MSEYLIGLDVGTSMTKAALFDRDGREIASAGQRTRVLSPHPGWFEMDADDLFAAATGACRDLLAKTGVAPGAVRGLGLSAVMIGGWLVDAGGAVLRPGMLWNDGRAQSLLDRLIAREPRLMSQMFDSSGQVMQLGCTLPVLAWLLENEPETVARAHAHADRQRLSAPAPDGPARHRRNRRRDRARHARHRTFNPALLDLFGAGADRAAAAAGR